MAHWIQGIHHSRLAGHLTLMVYLNQLGYIKISPSSIEEHCDQCTLSVSEITVDHTMFWLGAIACWLIALPPHVWQLTGLALLDICHDHGSLSLQRSTFVAEFSCCCAPQCVDPGWFVYSVNHDRSKSAWLWRSQPMGIEHTRVKNTPA